MNLALALTLFPILALLAMYLVFRHVIPLQETVDLSSYTVKDLRALAKERGIKGVSQLKKADLIKRLQ